MGGDGQGARHAALAAPLGFEARWRLRWMTTPPRRRQLLPRSNHRQLALIFLRGHHRRAGLDVDVHLAPHTNAAGDVHPRLDRECHPRNEKPLLARFEIIEVWPGSMEIARIDRVAGAMREVLRVPTLANHTARRVVDLRTSRRLPGARALLHEGNRTVPRVAHRLPNAKRFGG